MNNILKENEAFANIKCAKTFRITFYLLTFIYILDVVGLFIIDLPKMSIGYCLASIFLWVPTVLNHYLGPHRDFLKYLYVVCAAFFILAGACTLTYHMIVIYVYPMGIAALYFSKKLNILAAITSMASILAGNVISFYLETLPDKNFPTIYEVLLYSVFPKFLTMGCLAFLFVLIAERTKDMVLGQERSAEDLKSYHHEMVMGFATMVENRDDSTGGHINRTSKYAVMLANELKDRDIYSDVITDEFIENLKMAAPMHDVGKIGVPDSILKKPGALTEEEYEIMKTHAATGGQIIKETFGHTGNEVFNNMAYDVARFHHERWNGKGYPEGRMGYDIPLSARIMGVVDVFDAVSAERCYRPAMDVDDAFGLIRDGRGEDFEPILSDVFISMREQIIDVMEGNEVC